MNTEIKRKRASASSLFLMELVIAILYFSLAASLCITLFVQAHLQSENAKHLNAAVNLCSDTAELIRSSNSVSEAARRINSLYPLAVSKDSVGDLSIYFDENYHEIMSNAGTFCENISISQEGGTLEAYISFSGVSGAQIYNLNVAHAISP